MLVYLSCREATWLAFVCDISVVFNNIMPFSVSFLLDKHLCLGKRKAVCLSKIVHFPVNIFVFCQYFVHCKMH